MNPAGISGSSWQTNTGQIVYPTIISRERAFSTPPYVCSSYVSSRKFRLKMAVSDEGERKGVLDARIMFATDCKLVKRWL